MEREAEQIMLNMATYQSPLINDHNEPDGYLNKRAVNLKLRIKDIHRAFKKLDYIQPQGMINPEKIVTYKTLIGILSDRFGKHMTKV